MHNEIEIPSEVPSEVPSEIHSEGLQLRSPKQVMRLERMGRFFPTRLSFLRSLLRKLAEQENPVTRTVFALDDNGYGHAVYQVELDNHPYSLIAYSHALDPSMRTDRVIAEAWDACFIMYDGVPSEDDIAHLKTQAAVQEAGRYDPKVLVLSRANKSVRLFDHVVSRLAEGEQPDIGQIEKIGYLMRTTAVYGNGKFGLADRARFTDRPSLSQPFRLEMLTVYLIREFTLDLVQHVAAAQAGANAAPLDERVKKRLGIGNSTGLGMAPFLVNHPILINNWMTVRETALARVCALESASAATQAEFIRLTAQVKAHLLQWNVDDVPEQAHIVNLRSEWNRFVEQAKGCFASSFPWKNMMQCAEESFGIELQELLVAVILEPHGELIDGLCDCMEGTVEPRLDPRMTLAELRAALNANYDWALAQDLSKPSSEAMVWYVSEEKLEPRFGERNGADDDRREMPHKIAHKVQALSADLETSDGTSSLAEFLMLKPQHRDIVRRIQIVNRFSYGEVRDNLVAEGVRPIDLLRCKLSFFGASKFDPRSDRWTRITLYQGAPTAQNLTRENAGDVFLPAFHQDA